MTLRWSTSARANYLDYLRYLRGVAPASAKRAASEVEAETARIEKTPLMARPSRWAGMREWSLSRWSKIIVLRVDPAEIVIVAFVDARRDLSTFTPKDD